MNYQVGKLEYQEKDAPHCYRRKVEALLGEYPRSNDQAPKQNDTEKADDR